MQAFEVPSFIQHPTGTTLLDVLPVVSLFPCCSTLLLFHKTRRYADLGLFTAGFVLALVYHWCQACPQGLAASSFLQIPGVKWRTYDVLFCLILLTRTVGHIFGATSFPYSVLPNLLFPVVLVTLYLTSPRLEMSAIVILCITSMLTTGLAVVLVKEKPSVVIHRPFQGRLVFLCFYTGALCLFLPNLLGLYWLFHSLWHLFLAAGYHILYSELERATLQPPKPNGRKF